MEFHGNFFGEIKSSMEFHATREYGKSSMEFHGTLDLDKFHGIPWNLRFSCLSDFVVLFFMYFCCDLLFHFLFGNLGNHSIAPMPTK